ncbi:MAG TPA: septal ring lytic transglycosylase RlpA family protein [Cytophagaceae bacterium]
MKKALILFFILIYMPTTYAQTGYTEQGMASYYHKKFHGRKTASGEKFDFNALTAAHKNLPFQTMVKVTNLANNQSVIVRINDRGPFVKNRIIDLSGKAAKDLGMLTKGVTKVKIEVIGKSDDTDELSMDEHESDNLSTDFIESLSSGYIYNTREKSPISKTWNQNECVY